MATDPLVIYLNDHLAGSRSGLQLLDHIIESTKNRAAREELEGVRVDITADREVLEEIIRRVSGKPSLVREAGGWIAEKIAELKLVVDDPSNGPLRHLEALEMLALGIEGKRALWRALATSPMPALAGVNLPDLVRRAEDQIARVDALRIEAARAAFMQRTDSPSPVHATAKR